VGGHLPARTRAGIRIAKRKILAEADEVLQLLETVAA
jgi:hypothetical protein